MHEYSLVEALVTRVEEEARKRNALAVHKLSVRVGELSGGSRALPDRLRDLPRRHDLRGTSPHPHPRRGELVLPALQDAHRARRDPALPRVRRAGKLDDGSDALTLDGIEMEVP